MNRCVIIGGAPIENYNRIKKYFRSGDYVIACDCGLRHCDPLGIVPDLIVGDFDSFDRPDSDIEIIQLPVEKDDTDTMYAVKEAAARGYKSILLTGMTGRRIDHTLGNIYMLVKLHELGLEAVIADDYSELSLIAGRALEKSVRNSCTTAEVSGSFPYFSVIAIAGTASGISIRNAKYPLEDAVIEPGFQYGISNEVLPGMTAEISVKDGMLLVIKDHEG